MEKGFLVLAFFLFPAQLFCFAEVTKCSSFSVGGHTDQPQH